MSLQLDRIVVLAIFLTTAFLFSGAAHAAPDKEAVNSCVHCHSRLPSSSFLGDKSHSWVGSIHQKHGVTCDKCHGGNPEASEAEKAHKGVYGSSNPKSTVYFKNIPATCGACHGAEFYKFSQSEHYKMLESTGQGPECVTCHGSMVTRILSPDNLAAVCGQCHNNRMGILPYIPQKARAVLLLLRESKSLLDATAALHHPPEGSRGAELMRSARSSLQSAKLEWHKFDLNTITDYLQRMYNSLQALKNLKSEKRKGPLQDHQPEGIGSDKQ